MAESESSEDLKVKLNAKTSLQGQNAEEITVKTCQQLLEEVFKHFVSTPRQGGVNTSQHLLEQLLIQSV